MMNVLDSEYCSSGCESGWTLYLEQSNLLSPNKGSEFLGKTTGHGFCDEPYYNKEKAAEEEEVDEEEDLSMVSDASSGPPHNFHEDQVVEYLNSNIDINKPICFSNNKEGVDKHLSKSTTGKRDPKTKERRCFSSCGDRKQQPSLLDDTASSPLFNFSNMEDYTLTNNQVSVESDLDYSQAFSATHLEGIRPAFQGPFGFLQSNSLSSGNQLHEISGLKGRRWK